MAKLSLPFVLLLLLAIALPPLSGASSRSTAAADVECFQRPAGGDAVVHGSSVEPEEKSSDEDDDAGYILLPSDNNDDDDEEEATSAESSDGGSDEEEDAAGDQLGLVVGNVVTQDFFNSIISQAAPSCAGKRFYRRNDFLTAARSFPQFGQLKPDGAAKAEIAAFFAHVTHETGHLCYVEEINKQRYCDPTKEKQWPCAPKKQYYGRGPLQLTWNYNYGLFGKENRLDTLKNPDLVSRNGVVAWRASLWFWMKNVRPVVKKGFGETIRAINGALECGGKNKPAVEARVKYYTEYCKRFRIPLGPNLRC
ncbi:unnamed protein product [Linum tenue]|uniref:chitinase n=1 Tax=Linum tenue TaxID=586396 RepID=A0AAV0JLF2_9ROSI|nr:unnamed protein product [Linum tenue]